MPSLSDTTVHLIRGYMVREHVEEIGHGEFLVLQTPLVTSEWIEKFRRGEVEAPGYEGRIEFMAAHGCYRRHPGAVQPEAHPFTAKIDGEDVTFWRVRGWTCLKCRRTFYVGAASQLVHQPCCEGADW